MDGPVQIYRYGQDLRFYLKGLEDDYVGQFLINGRLYEEDNLDYIYGLGLEPQGVVLDVGAFIGTHAIFFQRCCQASIVHAFEPNPIALNLLRRNIAANHATVRVYDFALGYERSQTAAIFSTPPGNLAGARITLSSGCIVVKRLDDVFRDTRCDVIKIDVEGQELDVLLGARKTIVNHRPPHIFVETWPERTCAERHTAFIQPRVNELLGSLEYRLVSTLSEDLCHYRRCDSAP